MPKLTPEQRANAIQKLHDIITGDDTIPRLNTRASRAYLAAVDKDEDTSDLRTFAEVCRVAANLAGQLAADRDGDECVFTARPVTTFGRARVAARCVTCGVPVGGWTYDEARENFDRHKAIPGPPADVLARPIIKDDVRTYPEYFIDGRGRAVAGSTLCPHNYMLTDSCPGCDADQEVAEDARERDV